MAKEHWQKDLQLINAWQNGNERAFAEIYKQNYVKVKGALVQNLGISAEMAEEMFDEAMIVLNEKKRTFILEGLLSTFLYKIAKNKSIDELRKGQVKMLKNSIDLDDAEAEINDWSSQTFDHTTFAFDTEEADKILRQALHIMDGSICGNIFNLQYWGRLKLKDVAENLQMNESYIRRKVKECERKLKETVEILRSREL
ncbi:RNA polymerase sigma factor [Dyadobacter arcticus]|uniref:RNA polymerase sigma factor (Sigma-70 family) n=1 Tax=Dyadobacter arcticus TaxID=1078754 RepID=A0ABX0ULG3_9BACT|nr:sigma-70 family RNA polymerase sigma factor [Dyadobacter arcticus]NIJ52295.1 RNA polymerase sigma factor (sigma-70 family) [Dyadobacter arcticus]